MSKTEKKSKRPEWFPQRLWNALRSLGTLIAWLAVGLFLFSVFQIIYDSTLEVVNHANLPPNLVMPHFDWLEVRSLALVEIAMLWLLKYILDRNRERDDLVTELRALTALMKAREEREQKEKGS